MQPDVAGESVVEVRCPSGDLLFKVVGGDTIEVKCKNKRCRGAANVVLHRYSLSTGKSETFIFADPLEAARARISRKEIP